MKFFTLIFWCIFLLSVGNLNTNGVTPDLYTTSIETGCEQTSAYLPLLKGKSVALVANNSSLIGGTHLADSLAGLGIRITRIFSPEHGFRGNADAGATIDNTTDSKTGIQVVSLYGAKTKPTDEDLSDIDIVVYDIQDVGVRFYTYISTLHYVMEACAAKGIPMVVLDRPDPLGFYIDGPVLNPAFKSFVGLHPIPIVYAMTVGELAQMINGEGWLNDDLKCDLKVIPCVNYDHNSYYDLPVDPSPNLNSMEAIYLYPSLCFFEGSIMSLGRGTSFPFRVVGHPEYPEKVFSFMPVASVANKKPKYMDQLCYGIDLQSLNITELKRMRRLNLQWLIDVYQIMGRRGSFFTDYVDKLAGTDDLREQIKQGWTEQQIRESWQTGLDKFRIDRKKYLLYADFSVE